MAFRAGKKIGNPSKGKVRNATKVELDGIRFDSRLEAHFYARAKQLGVKMELKPGYTIIDPFVYMGKKIRPMTYTPDFRLIDHDMVVETKGFPNESFPLRLKVWMKYMVDTGQEKEFVLLKNKKEVDAFLSKLTA